MRHVGWQLISAMILGLAACQMLDPNRRAVPTTGAPTFAELNEATYTGLTDTGAPVQLKNGSWEGEPFAAGGNLRPVISLAQGFLVTGDLDGDGSDEAVVLLSQSSGGSGTFDSLAIVKRTPQGLRNIDTAALGDNVQIRSVRIEPGRMSAEVVRPGPDDAYCCPGELAQMSWPFMEDKLRPVETTVTGRLSLDTLTGKEWILRTWDNVEDAPREPEVMLVYADGRVAGRSGCNRYTATPTLGETPGEFTLGPIASTRMACPEPAASIESRFLTQLGAANRYGFFLGQLFISYKQDGGGFGVMRFDGRAPATPERALDTSE